MDIILHLLNQKAETVIMEACLKGLKLQCACACVPSIISISLLSINVHCPTSTHYSQSRLTHTCLHTWYSTPCTPPTHMQLNAVHPYQAHLIINTEIGVEMCTMMQHFAVCVCILTTTHTNTYNIHYQTQFPPYTTITTHNHHYIIQPHPLAYNAITCSCVRISMHCTCNYTCTLVATRSTVAAISTDGKKTPQVSIIKLPSV